MELEDKVKNHVFGNVKTDFHIEFGDFTDGAIELVCSAPGGLFEVGYFYGDIKPKNIIVASTQIGCPSKCKFCELGDKEFIRDLKTPEIKDQIMLMLQAAQRQGHQLNQVKHKISWSKSGDPLFNKHFVKSLEDLSHLEFSHKFSTVFPYGLAIQERFKRIADFAGQYSEPVQLQISLISTSEEYRERTAGIKVASFADIRQSAEYWIERNPNRKINLSLILDEDNPAEVTNVAQNFPPEIFRFRFRNYVSTENGRTNGLTTITEEKFARILEEFKQKGYDVGTWATPTPIEQKFGLAANVALRRYEQIVQGKI